MNEAAEELRFEEAAALRDRIAAIEETLERQRIVSMTGRNRDVFGLCREGDLTQIALLFVRGGRMIGQKTFPLIRLRAETGEILSSLLLRYYDGVADIPDEVVVPMALEDGEALAEWLAEKKGRGVKIVSPKRGETLALVGIAGRNAENALRNARLAADSRRRRSGCSRRNSSSATSRGGSSASTSRTSAGNMRSVRWSPSRPASPRRRVTAVSASGRSPAPTTTR